MATDYGTVFSTFSTLGKYYIRRALSEAKCSASEAMTGIGCEGKGKWSRVESQDMFEVSF